MIMYSFLNDENYTQPEFMLFPDILAAKSFCLSHVPDGYSVFLEQEEDGVRCLYEDGDAFCVIELLPVDVEAAEDFLLVWHHAYNGVDFKILEKGDQSKCAQAFEREKQLCLQRAELDWEDSEEAVFDTGEEWEMLHLLSVRKLMQLCVENK